jgi:hypothetical protein
MGKMEDFPMMRVENARVEKNPFSFVRDVYTSKEAYIQRVIANHQDQIDHLVQSVEEHIRAAAQTPGVAKILPDISVSVSLYNDIVVEYVRQRYERLGWSAHIEMLPDRKNLKLQ